MLILQMYHSEIFKTSFPLMKYDSLKAQHNAPKSLDSISNTVVPVYFDSQRMYTNIHMFMFVLYVGLFS